MVEEAKRIRERRKKAKSDYSEAKVKCGLFVNLKIIYSAS